MSASALAEVGRWLGGWPRSYVSIDIETNGVKPSDPRVLPVEVGWCLVEDGEVVVNDAVCFDWFLALQGEDAEDFARRLSDTAESMAKNGNRYPFTPRYLERQGVHPGEAMTVVATKLAECVAAGTPICGHNIVAFDRPILERTAREWASIPLTLPQATIVDTMCIARSLQKAVFPRPTGTREAWYAKLLRGPERCSLQGWCAERFAYRVDPDAAHGAGYDALLVHTLLENMRREAENATGGSAVLA